MRSRGCTARHWAVAVAGVERERERERGSPGRQDLRLLYSFHQLSGFDTYVQAVEPKTRSVYLVAPMRNGNHLSGAAAKGRYLVHGPHMTFPTGAYAVHHLKGIFKAAGKGYKPHVENELDNRFDLYENGINFMTCYALTRRRTSRSRAPSRAKRRRRAPSRVLPQPDRTAHQFQVVGARQRQARGAQRDRASQPFGLVTIGGWERDY